MSKRSKRNFDPDAADLPDEIAQYNQQCVCLHDYATHFKNGDCLAIGECPCKRFEPRPGTRDAPTA